VASTGGHERVLAVLLRDAKPAAGICLYRADFPHGQHPALPATEATGSSLIRLNSVPYEHIPGL